MKLKNKVAIVTGWAKWIWKAISLKLLKNDAINWENIVVDWGNILK